MIKPLINIKRLHMPDSTINGIQALIGGFVLSFILTVLRVIYDDQESRWQRVLFEALLNSSLTVASWAMVIAFDYPPVLAVGLGGLFAFLGVNTVRGAARKYINKKIDS